ncbi:MAG: ECF transporter S component [candidate division Zixibacteria bacterium]|nr:ECF transporter S component [candidate division Zixibacteria bacterium]
MNPRIQFIVRTALFLAISVVFPIAFHQFGLGGRVFLPMHIPVLLAGAMFGPMSGAFIGLLAPGLSAMITGMPPTYAVPLMTLELVLYGATMGLFQVRYKLNIYVALCLALIVGRIGFAVGLFVLGLFLEMPYGVKEFFTGAVIAGLPGIAIQIIFIPPLVMTIKKRFN